MDTSENGLKLEGCAHIKMDASKQYSSSLKLNRKMTKTD